MLCLKCHSDVPNHQLTVVFIRLPNEGPIWNPSYRIANERMCRECGKNNGNSLSEQEYEGLRERLNTVVS